MLAIIWIAMIGFIWAFCAKGSHNDNPLNLPE